MNITRKKDVLKRITSRLGPITKEFPLFHERHINPFVKIRARRIDSGTTRGPYQKTKALNHSDNTPVTAKKSKCQEPIVQNELTICNIENSEESPNSECDFLDIIYCNAAFQQNTSHDDLALDEYSSESLFNSQSFLHDDEFDGGLLSEDEIILNYDGEIDL